jgi:hypothetical protein
MLTPAVRETVFSFVTPRKSILVSLRVALRPPSAPIR